MKITTALILGIILTIHSAYAVSSFCTETAVPQIPSSSWENLHGCPNGTGGGGYITQLPNCNAVSYKCYKNTTGVTYFITTCTSCNTGYELTDATFTPGSGVCNNTLKYQNCVKESSEEGGGSGGNGNCTMDNCTKKSGWEAHTNTGYEALNYYACLNGVCTPTPKQYRCAAHYYGTTSDGNTGCTACPLSGSRTPEPGDSVPGSNTRLSDCYLRSGRSGCDDSGCFTVSGDCYHD